MKIIQKNVINQSDLVEGGFYKYIFRYDSGSTGMAIIKWYKKGNFPWLPLHKPGEYFLNTPYTTSDVIFETVSLEERRWLNACISANKFVSRESLFEKPITAEPYEIKITSKPRRILNEEKDISLNELLQSC